MTPTSSRSREFSAYPHAMLIDPHTISTPLLAYEEDYEDDDDLDDFEDFDDEDFDDDDFDFEDDYDEEDDY